MPILAAEPDLYPDSLFDSPEDGRQWLVAQTKPRQEKALARSLMAAALPHFSPATPRRNLVRGRIVIARIPLFANYVFVRGLAEERRAILATGRIVKLMAVADQERLWSDLRQVWHLTGTGLPLHPAEALDAGAKVRIRSGPMAGLTGSIVRTAGRQHFIVAVDFLGKGVAVEMESETLARLPLRRACLAGAVA